MKKIATLLAVMVAGICSLAAQNYMVVESEMIFKSLAEYNKALTDIDAAGEKYQRQVDARFDAVEKSYNSYIAERDGLSAAERKSREEAIVKQESEATKYQESIFGQGGKLISERLELIAPIQKRVFDVINDFAQERGYDLVLDASSNPAMLFSSDRVNRTQDIINRLK